MAEGGQQAIDGGRVVVDDPIVQAVKVLVRQGEQGLAMLGGLGGSFPLTGEAIQFCFYGNDAALGFFGRNVIFIFYLYPFPAVQTLDKKRQRV